MAANVASVMMDSSCISDFRCAYFRVFYVVIKNSP